MLLRHQDDSRHYKSCHGEAIGREFGFARSTDCHMDVKPLIIEWQWWFRERE
ncbi:MAG: hypothetical protein JWO42_2169 [Chloroflexi bacterium]|nr:hypothetical protein [Chloroflexota bacterium]